MGDWGLGIGDWGLGPIPNPQSPIPNPQSPMIYIFNFDFFKIYLKLKNKKFKKNNFIFEIKIRFIFYYIAFLFSKNLPYISPCNFSFSFFLFIISFLDSSYIFFNISFCSLLFLYFSLVSSNLPL